MPDKSQLPEPIKQNVEKILAGYSHQIHSIANAAHIAKKIEEERAKEKALDIELKKAIIKIADLQRGSNSLDAETKDLLKQLIGALDRWIEKNSDGVTCNPLDSGKRRKRGAPRKYDKFKTVELVRNWETSGMTKEQYERERNLKSGDIERAQARLRKRGTDPFNPNKL